MVYRKPKRYFEKPGLVDPADSYHVRLENVVNMDQQDMHTMVDAGRYFFHLRAPAKRQDHFFPRFLRTVGNRLSIHCARKNQSWNTISGLSGNNLAKGGTEDFFMLLRHQDGSKNRERLFACFGRPRLDPIFLLEKKLDTDQCRV